MSVLDSLALAFGTSFASGLNLYATVGLLGLLHRFEVVTLPDSWRVLAHPLVLGIAVAFYLVEFVADKVPYVDSLWDTIHTFVRPPAAALLAYGALGELPEPWRVAAVLVAGGLALTSHGGKATTRAAANASPEPLSNWILSLGEDAVAVGLVWLATSHPYLTLAVVAVALGATVFLLARLARAIGRIGRPARPTAEPL